jgi:hydroxyacylglutathione hydrolase
MFFKRFYDDGLAQASFMVGCDATHEAVVIDANRDIQQYVDAAAAEGAKITHVAETHIHADFISGSRELAATVGARLLLSREGGADWQYAFAEGEGATLIGDGSVFNVGKVAFEVMHTPGHTPEHVTFLVTDTPATDRAMGAFTGDFIFAGDVGRPDLLERAAHVAGTMESSARTLYKSLRRFRSLPEYLILWPGHGAGSACGKALGSMPQTTLGYERVSNWAFRVEDEHAFVREVLAGQPEPPKYFAEMKRINRDGPPMLDGFREPPRADPARLAPLIDAGALVIDTRRAEAFAAGHVPGTINIPLSTSFSTYAGSVVSYDADFHLIVDDGSPGAAAAAARDLAMIGLDRIAGAFGSGALDVWSAAGRTLEITAQIAVRDAGERAARGEIALLDVRGRSEWDAGHARGATHIPVGELADRLAELPKGRPLAVICQGGTRSAIAASMLLARRAGEVLNVGGGFAEWERAELPVERAAAGG